MTIKRKYDEISAKTIQAIPIQGPLNWDQIWYDWNDVGLD